MVGIPCAGKSTRAAELKQYFEQTHSKEVQIINEEFLGLPKAQYLASPQQEKILRASLKSNVERFID